MKGFTLVEVLISMAVLVLIVMLVNQIVNSTATTTLNAFKRMDSDDQARLIFAKMAADFAAMYKRPDINYYFKSEAGNDGFYFYSHAPGHIASQDPAGTDDASLNSASLVGYRVSNTVSNGSRVELERLGRGLHWMDIASQTESEGRATSVLFLPSLIKNAFSKTLSDPYNNSSNIITNSSSTEAPQWDVIGDQVFRMEFCFLLTNGTSSVKPVLANAAPKNNLTATAEPGANADASAGYSLGSRWYDTGSQIAYSCTNPQPGAAVWTPIGLQDVQAVIVTIALMDAKSRLTTTTGAINKAIECLPDATAGSPLKTWVGNVKDPATIKNSSGLSAPAVSSIRVYERAFLLK